MDDLHRSEQTPELDVPVVVCGAGPAGLTAAYRLTGSGRTTLVLEADPEYVGGISRTVRHNGYGFDIGGHRFFSKVPEIEALWDELLPGDLIVRKRRSRIYYRGRFFDYPLKPFSAVAALGPKEVLRCLTSFAHARMRPVRDPSNFEDWMTNEFGSRLYELFFKTYTEKVWGMSCRDISADWAAQRIRGLSLSSAVGNALRSFLPHGFRGGKEHVDTVKTLIDRFRYPRLGPGMMWEACADRIRDGGGRLLLGRRVVGLERTGGRWRVTHRGIDGDDAVVSTDDVVSSLPLQSLAGMLDVGEDVRRAADNLRYRDFLTVALIMRDRDCFDDHWIYVQDPGVRVGRIQNYKAWSPEMVPDPDHCCYGLEYFCFEGDGLWESSDTDLIQLAINEIHNLGLADRSDFKDGCVVRQPKAYPVYDGDYATHVACIRKALREYPGLHPVGRNGLHQYNNQDHSMMTAMLTVRNILAGEALFDPWRVNQDAVYHESEGDAPVATSGRSVPERVRNAAYPDSAIP